MDFGHLGSTGPLVSRIGLGMAALGRPGYINLGHGNDLAGRTDPPALETQAHRVLDAAYSAGVSYFDAARSYGRAEELLADWLQSVEGAPIIGSKWGYVYNADWQTDAEVHEVKVHTAENLDRQLAESRALLGSWLRLYQIHSATLESGVLEDRDVVERLAQLKADGVIIGFSTSGPSQGDVVRRALQIEHDGTRLFGAVQATWNLLEPSAGAALAEAAAAGLGVIVKEAVANGRLTPRNADLASSMGLPSDLSLDAVAMAAALSQPWASVVLSGAATIPHLESNLSALAVPRQVVDALPDLAEAPHEYWATRANLSWG